MEATITQLTKAHYIGEIDKFYFANHNVHVDGEIFDELYDMSVEDLVGYLSFLHNKEEMLRDLAATIRSIVNK